MLLSTRFPLKSNGIEFRQLSEMEQKESVSEDANPQSQIKAFVGASRLIFESEEDELKRTSKEWSVECKGIIRDNLIEESKL